MALTHSEMLPLGMKAPPFTLPVANPDDESSAGARCSLGEVMGERGLLVMFWCNHCPYVHAVEDRVIDLAAEVHAQGVGVVAICANDASTHPEDSFENMAERAHRKRYPFPYLRDDTQEVARAYGAACTPDFMLFDEDGILQYRGRLDDGRPTVEPTTTDLADAIAEMLATGTVTRDQLPSMGCNIKWAAERTA